MTRIVCVSVSLDGIEEHGARLGLRPDALTLPDDETEPIYGKAWPRFLGLFARLGLSATFFPLGRYLGSTVPVALAREALATGHELGNGGQAGPLRFDALSPAALVDEIVQGERAIQDATKLLPRGFLSPGHQPPPGLAAALSARGYAYDASILPTPPALSAARALGPLLQRFGVSLPAIPGTLRTALSPLVPYHPAEDSLFRRGSSPLLELPVSALPLVHVPLVGNWLLRLGSENAKALLAPARSAPFLHLSLSGADLLAAEDVPEALRAKRPDLARPLQEREDTLSAILDTLCEGAQSLTLLDACPLLSSQALR